MSEIDAWLDESSPHTVTEYVCFDRSLVGELEEAQSQLTRQSMGMLEVPAELEKRVEKLKAQVAEKTKTFVFVSIGRTAWRKILSEHPPTPEQIEEYGRHQDHNPEEFPFAAMAASCKEPGLTTDQAKKLAEVLPVGVFDRLWGACLSCNLTGGDEKKAVGTVVPLRSAKK